MANEDLKRQYERILNSASTEDLKKPAVQWEPDNELCRQQALSNTIVKHCARVVAGEKVMADIIEDVSFSGDRVCIKVSDGSLIQFGLRGSELDQLKRESSFLIGATIEDFKHDQQRKHFRLDYRPRRHPSVRHFDFFYRD